VNEHTHQAKAESQAPATVSTKHRIDETPTPRRQERRTRKPAGHLLLLMPFLLAFATAFLASLTLAQSGDLPQPVDPLKRAENTPGRFSFNISFGYKPTGGRVLDFNEDGVPYTKTYAVHRLTPAFALGYAVTDRFSLGAGLTVSYRIEQTINSFDDGTSHYSESGSHELLPRVSLSYRLEPDNPLDPSLSLSLYKPWALEASLSLSAIRDPIVLSGSLAYWHSFMPPFTSSLTLSSGVGFVANDRISLSASASLNQPLIFASSPSLSLGLSTSYNFDPAGNSQIAFNINTTLSGGVADYGLSFSYSLRELDFELPPD